MSGKPGRSGRKPLPVAVHLLKGSYRPSRHGLITSSSAPLDPAALRRQVDGLGEAGRALMLDHLAGLVDWSPRDLALLRQAAEARDRQVAFQQRLAEDGLVVEVRGRRSAHPLVRAERQAGAAVVTALRAIDVRGHEAAVPSRRGA